MVDMTPEACYCYYMNTVTTTKGATMPTIYELNNMYGKTVNITTEDGFVYLGSVMAGVSGSSDKVWLDEKTGIWFLYRHQIKNIFVVE